MTFAAAPSLAVDCPGWLNVVNATTACWSGDLNTPQPFSVFVDQPGGAWNFTYGCSTVIHWASARCGAAGVGSGVGVSLLATGCGLSDLTTYMHTMQLPRPSTPTTTRPMSAM